MRLKRKLKKGTLPAADSRGPKSVPKGGKGDLVKVKTPKIVEKVHFSKEVLPLVTCVMGLQCKTVTIAQINKGNLSALTPESETPTPHPDVPLAPKRTRSLVKIPKPVPNDKNVGDGGTTLKRKRGRPLRSKPNTPLPPGKEVAKLEKKQVEHTKSPKLMGKKSVKGKRGKRRKIRSINVVSPVQGGEDPLSKQKENERMENEVVEKSPDTMSISISDDQPLSRWFKGIHHQPSSTLKKGNENVKSNVVMTKGENDNKLSFEKRSTLWGTLESMELFKMVQQNPHFRPLDNEKECTREGKAISKMVMYLRVVEATSQMKMESLKCVFEDSLEALVELESHGFDVMAVRDRLTGLLLMKEKHQGFEEEARKVREKMEVERVEGERIDKESEIVDKQVVALLEKRAHVMKKKEKIDAEIGDLEADVDGINEDMFDVRTKFHALASASLCVSEQQTPT